jgi:hypothetical protein
LLAQFLGAVSSLPMPRPVYGFDFYDFEAYLIADLQLSVTPPKMLVRCRIETSQNDAELLVPSGVPRSRSRVVTTYPGDVGAQDAARTNTSGSEFLPVQVEHKCAHLL